MKKFAKRLASLLVLFALVAGASFVGNLVYQKYTKWRFSGYVCDYSHQIQRRAAYAAFELAKPHITLSEQSSYEKRLEKLEDDYQHPYRTALHNLSDPTFLKKKVDSFGQVLTDINFSFKREESPGKEIWALCRTEGEICCIAWPFVLEDLNFPRADGTPRTISYEDCLKWKEKFEPVQKEMETLLATYEEK